MKLIIVLVLFSVTGTSYGQSSNEISLYLKGSFAKLDYQVLQQKSDIQNGWSVGAGYSYYLSENWSIGTGAELQYMEGSIDLSTIEDAYLTKDPEGEAFEFGYQTDDFRENQYVYFLNIPLQVQYETNGDIRWYAAGGIKAGLVLQSEYKTQASSLVTDGYYGQYDVELTGPKFAGFGEFGPVNTVKSELGIKTNWLLNLETGVKFMLKNHKSLYAGLFMDYGLNNIQPEETQKSLIGYNSENPTNFLKESLLSSTNNTASEQYVDEVKTLAFGLKIQYSFHF